MTATLEVGEPRTGSDHAVRLSGVGKTFGGGRRAVTALDGVDLTVAPGEFVCLLGASGCGKTTVLNLVAGLDAPSAGEIELNTTRPAVMFQEAALMPWLTAIRNVELPLRLAGVKRAARRARAGELLALVRLDGVGDKRPHELSGGMRQRVALARALASALVGSTKSMVALAKLPTKSGTAAERDSQVHEPTRHVGRAGAKTQRGGENSLLLMDEPFSALDAITRDVLQSELLRIWHATGTAVLFVTHDVREAVRLGQRVVLLSSRPGRVVQEWHAGDLSAPEQAATVDEINARLHEVISTHATG
jgi:NitT/TauT family transport system ATP-binding protein